MANRGYSWRRITEAKSMREQYIARARTAQTTTKVNDMLTGMGTENSMKVAWTPAYTPAY